MVGMYAHNQDTRSEMDKVVLESNNGGPSKSRPRRSTSSLSHSYKADSESEHGESPPPMETQFRSQGEDSDDQLWEADCILDERGETAKGEYLVKWVGYDPKTGENWEPTWERRDGVTPLLAKEWKTRKKSDPGIVGVEGKRLLAEQKKKREEERRKKTEARKAKSRKGKKRATPRSSEAIDLVKSRSSTADSASYVPGRTKPTDSTGSSKVGTTERDTPKRKPRKSGPPISITSSKGVPVVVLPSKSRASEFLADIDPEEPEENAAASKSPIDVEIRQTYEDNGDDLLAMYTNEESDFQDHQAIAEDTQAEGDLVGAENEAESPAAAPATKKRAAPASSPPAEPPVSDRQKRVRIASEAKDVSLEASDMPSEKSSIEPPTSVVLTDTQFKQLMPPNDSTQSISSTQSPPDPIQQFSSPARNSLAKSKAVAKTAGTSKLAKGVQIKLVNGEEVLGVDTDSGSEGGLEPERTQGIVQDADTVDVVEPSPVVAEESASIPAPESDPEFPPVEPEVQVEETVAALETVENPSNASSATGDSIEPNGTAPTAVSASAHPLSAPGPSDASAPPQADLTMTALREMIAELETGQIQGWEGNGSFLETLEGASATRRELAAEVVKIYAILKDKVEQDAGSSVPTTRMDMGLQTEPVADTSISMPAVTATTTADAALQTDSTSKLIISSDAGSQTNPIPEAAPTVVSDMAAQTDSLPAPPALDQTAFEEQLAAKDADRKKWRTRAKRAEAEVTSIQEDLTFIRERYDEASASAVREVAKSTELAEKMTILQDQLKFGLKQRELHNAAVKSQQNKQVTILVAQNKILLEQSRRTDDAVRSRAAAYHEVESQRDGLEHLLRNAMRKIDDLSDRNDELVSQIEVLRAKQMGVLNDHVEDESNDEDYSFEEGSDSELSGPPSPDPTPSPSPSPSPEPTQSTGASGSANIQSHPAFVGSAESLTASQLMPDTQDLLSAEHSLESDPPMKRPSPNTQVRKIVSYGEVYRSPWGDGTSFFPPPDSTVKEHIMRKVNEEFA